MVRNGSCYKSINCGATSGCRLRLTENRVRAGARRGYHPRPAPWLRLGLPTDPPVSAQLPPQLRAGVPFAERRNPRQRRKGIDPCGRRGCRAASAWLTRAGCTSRRRWSGRVASPRSSLHPCSWPRAADLRDPDAVTGLVSTRVGPLAVGNAAHADSCAVRANGIRQPHRLDPGPRAGVAGRAARIRRVSRPDGRRRRGVRSPGRGPSTRRRDQPREPDGARAIRRRSRRVPGGIPRTCRPLGTGSRDVLGTAGAHELHGRGRPSAVRGTAPQACGESRWTVRGADRYFTRAGASVPHADSPDPRPRTAGHDRARLGHQPRAHLRAVGVLRG